MALYICPMHSDREQEKPGKCPKCGMKLILKGSAKHEANNSNYTPLLVIIGLILLTSLTLAFSTGFSFPKVVFDFMIGFFLVFSGFKLIDLSGFAQGYATYDLLAQKAYGYGYIYPFIELLFALAMILDFYIKAVLAAELIVMVFSGMGVLLKLAKHEKFQCACLGTFLKVPLTKITLVEDFGMAALAIFMLISK